MNSKTLKYLSYSTMFLAIILMAILNLWAGYKIHILFFFIPAGAISQLLKLWALNRANLENRDSDYIDSLKNEIKIGRRAMIALICLAGIKLIYLYS